MSHPLSTKAARYRLADALRAVVEKHGGKCTIKPDHFNPRELNVDVDMGTVKANIPLDTLHRDGAVLIHWHGATVDLTDAVFGDRATNPYHHRKATSHFHASNIVEGLDALLARYTTQGQRSPTP